MATSEAVELSPKHKLHAAPGGTYSVCAHCGVESEVTLVGNAARRMFRHPGGAWEAEILCTYVAPPPPVPVQTDEPAENVGVNAANALERHFRRERPDLFAPEVTDGHSVQEAADHVDLSVEHSPVLLRRGSVRPLQASLLDDGRYRVYLDESESHSAWGGYGMTATQDVTAAELRVMRARYLLMRGALYRELHLLPPRRREAVERMYFPGGVFVPTPGSRLGEVVRTGQPLSIKLEEGQTHEDVMAQLLHEAGAKDARLVLLDEQGKPYAAKALVPSAAAPVPMQAPPEQQPVPCRCCHRPTPGGICDQCLDLAQELDLPLSVLFKPPADQV